MVAQGDFWIGGAMRAQNFATNRVSKVNYKFRLGRPRSYPQIRLILSHGSPHTDTQGD